MFTICELVVKWKERSSILFPCIDLDRLLGLGLVLTSLDVFNVVKTKHLDVSAPSKLCNLLFISQGSFSMSCDLYVPAHMLAYPG